MSFYGVRSKPAQAAEVDLRTVATLKVASEPATIEVSATIASCALDLNATLDAEAIAGAVNVADLCHIGKAIASKASSLALSDPDAALNGSLATATIVGASVVVMAVVVVIGAVIAAVIVVPVTIATVFLAVECAR